MANLTLLDLITLQNNDTLTGLVEDVTTAAPEFETFSAIPRPGTFYYVLRRTALPAGGFRNLNDGVTPTKSIYKKEVKEMFFLDMPIVVDEAIIKADDGSTGSVWQHEAAGVLRQAGIIIGSQVWYGTTADAKGFAGVRAQLSGNIGTGGSTSSTSAYLCWMDPKEGCRFDVGQNGAFNLPTPIRQQITAPSGSGSIMAWVSNLSSYVGFSVVSDKATWAVTGIDASNKLTDEDAANLISNIPIARRNNLRWFMNRTAAYTLQSSRTAINYQPAVDGTGRPAFAPKPTDLEGYPITLTDSITNTETN